nr:ABC transporter ATP-binding protein [Paenibacillus shirakamiensis]
MAIIMLLLAVVAELTGPFIAKKIIDVHILGIEKPWNEVQIASKQSVLYQGHRYKRSDHFVPGEAKGKEVRILQVGTTYIFVPQSVPEGGQRSFENQQLTMKNGDNLHTYPAKEISAKELWSFYQPQFNGMIMLLVLYLGLMVVASGFEYGRVYFLQSSANRVIQQMRDDVYHHIHKLPMKYFDQNPAGSVMSRVTSDTESVKELFISVMSSVVSGSVYLVSIFVALFILNVKLAWICTLIVPCLILWIILYRKLATTYNRVNREHLSRIHGSLNEMIRGIPLIHAFGRQKTFEEKLGHTNEQYYRSQTKLLSLDALTSYSLANVLKSLVLALVIWYFGGASLGPASAITFGVVYAFVDYIGRMFQPVVGIVNQLSNLERSLVAAERVFELMDIFGTDLIEVGTPISRTQGNVAFENVWFSYTTDDPVLKNISFEAKSGETIAFVGHTGAGKSSIVNALLRFYEIEQGLITIDDVDTRQMSLQQIRQCVGIVLQDTVLLSGTIASNISLNHPKVRREQIVEALIQVGGAHLIQSLPLGLDEPVIDQGSTLSIGQRQMVAFARALIYNPAILILDEATSNMDTETEAMIQSALDVVSKERTTFIIAHRLSTIRRADQILVIQHGEIVERGNHEQLMDLGGVYAQMNQVQRSLEKVIG